MKKDKPHDPPPDVPAWIMTYSDVITLLMTFFILLLTFSTTEPESFEKVQLSLFGDTGSSGFMGPKGIALDSIVVRERPPSARMSVRGAEMAPIHTDPAMQALKAGLESLESSDLENPAREHEFTVYRTILIDDRGELTELGRQWLRMFGRQMATLACELTIRLGREADVPAAFRCADYLTAEFPVHPGRIAISVTDSGNPETITFAMTQPQE